MKRTFVLTLVVAACASGQQASPAVAVAVDVSRSTRSAFEVVKREQQALIAALPDGSYCAVLTVGGAVNRVFEGRIDSNSRAQAQSVIGALEAKDWNSDLAAGVIDAIASVANVPGQKEIWMFTDGELRPKRGSPYVGRTFASVLADLKIGPETKVFVRLMGTGKLTVARPQISVTTAAPDWKSHYRPAPAAPPKPSRPDVKPNWAPWWVGSAAASIAALVLAHAIWRRMRMTLDECALRAAIGPEIEPQVPATLRPVRTYKVRQAGGTTFELDPDGVRELTIGYGALADIELNDAAGGDVRLRLQGEGDESTPMLENIGSAVTFVGTRRVGAGAVKTLPKSGCEVRVGRDLFFVYPEIRNEVIHETN